MLIQDKEITSPIVTVRPGVDGAGGVLIVTEDDPRGGIDCIKIEELIKTVIMS